MCVLAKPSPFQCKKLQFRSTRCAFLGYSSLHKGYKCLDISTGCVYISRDVIFDENIFPFADLHPNVGAKLTSEILLLSPNTRGTPVHSPAVNVPTNPLSAEENLAQNDAGTGSNHPYFMSSQPSMPTGADTPADSGPNSQGDSPAPATASTPAPSSSAPAALASGPSSPSVVMPPPPAAPGGGGGNLDASLAAACLAWTTRRTRFSDSGLWRCRRISTRCWILCAGSIRYLNYARSSSCVNNFTRGCCV